MRLYNRIALAVVRTITAWCKARGRYVDYRHALPSPWVGVETYMRRYVIFGHMTGNPEPGWLRGRLPNVYLHHMYRPDADDAVHDHPWPWAVSFILLGGYRETRDGRPDTWHDAPALNFLRGTDYHRVSDLADPARGTFTLFLAGPRAYGKPWGYLVEGRGRVDQKVRHAEIGASERQAVRK